MFKPIFITHADEWKRQKPSEAVSIFMTFRMPLKPRITCPLIWTTIYTDEKGVKHESKKQYEPVNPSYNLEHLVYPHLYIKDIPATTPTIKVG